MGDRPAETNAILVRYDEIFLKRGRRRYFLDTLDRNLRRALKPFAGLDVLRPHGRFLIQQRGTRDLFPPPPIPEAGRVVRALSRVFGVASVSPAFALAPGLETLQREVPPLATSFMEAGPATTFAVATRRVDKLFPLSSPELNRELGSLVWRRHPELKVDLARPDLKISIEVRENGSYVFCEQIPGPGGLPVGSNGRVLALLSGGIDSPVACWSIMKRGVEVEAVYFHSFPYTSEAVKDKVHALAQEVGRWQGAMRLHVVPFTAIQRACRDNAPPKLLVLLYRRFMFRLAEAIAHRLRAQALVTGESLGQVASQTLSNLDAIQRVVTMPILQPLIASDKQEIIRLAEELGTYEISIQPFDDCCSLFVPKHPSLRPRVADLERVERRLPMEELITAALDGVEVL